MVEHVYNIYKDSFISIPVGKEVDIAYFKRNT